MPPEQPSMEHPEVRISDVDPVELNNLVEVVEKRAGPNDYPASLRPTDGHRTKRQRTGAPSVVSKVSSRSVDDNGRIFFQETAAQTSLRDSQSLSGAGTWARETQLPPKVEIVSLADELNRAKVRHYNSRTKDWVPVGELRRICSPEAVGEELKGTVDASRVEEYKTYVCGKTSGDFKDGHSASIVFAILVATGRLSMLDEFLGANIRDKHFPFTYGNDGMLHPHKKDPKSRGTLPRFPSTDGTFITSFYREQWYFNVPIISMSDYNEPAEYKLHHETIMPWTHYRRLDEEGWHAKVFEIKIHPGQHFFTGQNLFALKTLSSNDPKEYRQEVYALRKATPGPHVIQLYATFECGDKFSFLFPWAEGGNLGNLMKMHPSELFPWATDHPDLSCSTILIRWIARQCAGIAKGLTGIHNAKRVARDKTGGPGQCKDDFGIHRDIKPGNILRFIDKKLTRDLGELKLADFGLTRFHTASKRSAQPGKEGRHETYGAPEQATDGPFVSRKADVWALGCVFLLLLTWAIRGPGALRRFECARLKERGRCRKGSYWPMDTFFTTDARVAWQSDRDDVIVKRAVELRVQLNKKAVSKDGEANYLTEFLDFILSDMLVVNTDDRASSDDVHKFLDKKAQEYNTAGHHVCLPTLDGSVNTSEPECTCDIEGGQFHCEYQIGPTSRVAV